METSSSIDESVDLKRVKLIETVREYGFDIFRRHFLQSISHVFDKEIDRNVR